MDANIRAILVRHIRHLASCGVSLPLNQLTFFLSLIRYPPSDIYSSLSVS